MIMETEKGHLTLVFLTDSKTIIYLNIKKPAIIAGFFIIQLTPEPYLKHSVFPPSMNRLQLQKMLDHPLRH